MKSKKKQILIGVSSLFIIILGIGLYLWFNKDNDTQVYENNREQVKEQISGFNGISMMYETGPDTGEYSESKSSLWPESGYIFNENLSGCENGGELSWNKELGAVNLRTNTSEKCYVYFDMYIIPVINSVTTSNIETDSIILTVNVTNGNNPVTTYYYSNNNGSSYVSSNSNTYTFSGLDMGTEYNFSVYVEDIEGYKSEVYNLSETTDDTPPTLADTCRQTGSNTLACHVVTTYTTDGENGLYYHDGTGSYFNANLEAGDNSYRYSGANPNNYVCFGSDEAICPEDDLYRIIGVFGNQVKLIKWDYMPGGGVGEPFSVCHKDYGFVGDYYKGNYSKVNSCYWDSEISGTNDWEDSGLNDYLIWPILASFSEKWADMISNYDWQIGGNIQEHIRYSNAQIAFNHEIGEVGFNQIYNGKMGLIYVSDYYYAANPIFWSYPGFTNFAHPDLNGNYGSEYDYRAAVNDNWIYMGLYEFTMTRLSEDNVSIYVIYDSGSMHTTLSYGTYDAFRPVFYLNSNVTYVSGTGTQSDPFRIK